jgi:tetratricopeptide (TPR) repeat protein
LRERTRHRAELPVPDTAFVSAVAALATEPDVSVDAAVAALPVVVPAGNHHDNFTLTAGVVPGGTTTYSSQPSQARPVQQQQQQQQLQTQENRPAPADIAQHSARCVNEDKSAKPETSIASCNTVIQETAKSLAAAYFYRGASHVTKNDLDRAIADYSQAIAIDPTESDYLNSRAAIYEHKNDMQRAMADYDQAIKLNPRSAYAFNNRGASFQRKGDFARASADYGEVTKLQPKNIDAWAARCWVRAAGGREVQQALSDCNEALKLKPDAPDVLDTRGFANLRLGRHDDAIRDYEAALKLDPKMPGALYGRGVAKIRKNDRTGGMADITAAKSMKSDIETEFSRYGIRP